MRHFHYLLSAPAIKMHKRACFIPLAGQLCALLTGSHSADEIVSERQIISRPGNILLTDARWDPLKASAHVKMEIPDGCAECDVTAASVSMRCFSNLDSIREKMKICLGWIIAAQLFTFSDQPNTNTHLHTLECLWVLCFLCRMRFEGCFLLQLFELLPLDLRFYSFDYL